MRLSLALITAIEELKALYPRSRSALIPSLHLVQDKIGYLPQDIQNEIAHLFAIDPTEVAGVVSFYEMFHEEPKGKQVIHICTNIACHLRGGETLLKECESRLGVERGKTSSDGLFTLLECECLAACDRAPAALINEQLVGPISSQQLCDSIQSLHQEEK